MNGKQQCDQVKLERIVNTLRHFTRDENKYQGSLLRPAIRKLTVINSAILALVLFPHFTHAQNYQVLHSFTGNDGSGFNGDTDGANPEAPLIQGPDGYLYGTTVGGSAIDTCYLGTVFKLSVSGNTQIVHYFRLNAGDDGRSPKAGLFMAGDGKFYGTTPLSTSLCGGSEYGTVFRLSASGAFNQLHLFSGLDGSTPIARVIQHTNGYFYGTTTLGGQFARGTVFRMCPPEVGGQCQGSSLVAYPFTLAFNLGGLVQGTDGNLYGRAENGGAFNFGMLFKMTPDGAFTTLHSFAGGDNDGATPRGDLIQATDGYFYGTTYGYGCAATCNWGTVFRMDASGNITERHRFNFTDGAFPRGSLIQASDGNLYGTTQEGGQFNFGTVFKLNLSTGVLTTLHSFGSQPGDGIRPYAGLIQADGNFYGTTRQGGSQAKGTVFRLDGPATVQFSAANYDVTEDCTLVRLTVTRTGDTTGASTVDFTTSDGGALQRTDYTIGSGTVSFAAGEASKTFNLLITEDHYVEGAEQFGVTLTNPTGAVLGIPNVATVTINDDDTMQAPSPSAKTFGGTLGGGQETPANNSPGRGLTLIELSADEMTAKISLAFSGVVETAAHIHRGARAVSGPIVFSLPNGNFNAQQISMTTQQVSDLKAGLLYVNVHSSSFPDGEIRAQLEFNPIDNADLFVGQHYHDFLSRQADTGGQQYWTSSITNCGNDAGCMHNARINVSNAFYYEQEFQQTGSYAYRLYRAAYGNNQPFPNPNPDPAHPNEEKKVPLYLPFMRDRARVRGGAQLAAFQLALANAFVVRGEFLNKYPANQDGPPFVDAVLATITNDIGVNLTSQRQALIDLYTQGGGGAAGRANVMYRLGDDNATGNPINNRTFIDAEYNRAFVFTQYAGYLRRNADMAGFLFWLGQVNGAPLRDVPRQHAMVCSFITSTEYQLRFGAVVTHSNTDCLQ